MNNCVHDYEPDVLMTKMRCEKCGEDAPRRTYADLCLERASKATEGPWETDETEVYSVKTSKPKRLPTILADEEYLRANDAYFIAHSRTDVPKLARRLKIALDYLKQIEAMKGVYVPNLSIFIQELESENE